MARPELEALAVRLGLQDRVIFAGPVPQEEVLIWLAAADVTLNPYRDSLVNRAKCAGKLIDYMAAAKPVVAAALGQNVEYLEDGVSGILTEQICAGPQSKAERLLDIKSLAALGPVAKQSFILPRNAQGPVMVPDRAGLIIGFFHAQKIGKKNRNVLCRTQE